MPLKFRCVCGRKLKGPEDAVGKRAKCPECHRWLRIPQSGSYKNVAKSLDSKSADSEAIHAKPALKAEKPADDSAPETNTGKGKACIIAADSDPAALKTLVQVLKNHGYAVHETSDGTKTVEMIREHCPDAAVVDIHLDNLAGFQVVKQIRDMANELNKDVWQIPMLMTTQKVRGRDKQYAISIGVQGYYDKPLNPARLCARLEKEIAKYRSR